ncbi:MAG: GTP-binding protein Obg [uncultured Solirubrobacterales bacterium]|uniref:GTPase Obg n=1 Tax=uncultured Solirubrobacterales bacterium TaxID=768556 RepID=A0A6J4S7X1_9ACTN|nr:MAG: GTP-binding protein Obg [uncultured Solirubrobacterales bacterium]
MLSDRAKIFVQAGAGGNGVVSFRREAHVPRGGPDGGDGGRGADVVLVCDPSLRDLAHFRRRAHFKAARGGHGEGANRHGASPAELQIAVAPGTVVDDPLHEARYDLRVAGERAVVAQGGSGGRGNRRFATPTRQAPRFAERGLPGEEGWIELRLKLLADAGLVGLPNAGKSSLLARLTRAHPRVAEYPFTTLEPVLGVLEGEERQLVMADIPGLIEGAHEGAGLGHDFLAHIERTRLLVHVLDLAPVDGSDPVANHATVEAELAGHGAGLEGLPRVLCLSKADLVPPEQAEVAAADWRERLGESVCEVLVTSAATGQGLEELGAAVLRAVPPPAEDPDRPGEAPLPTAAHRVYRPGGGESFDVAPSPNGGFRVTGAAVERLVARHDLENPDALRYLEERLRGLGVVRALEAAGFTPGDDVEIAGTVFELDPGAPLT